ncbi:AAA family ATPase [Agrobacterium tumefaciens]|uniref:AAA family ATPase n=1 Tax=Agrobacterium tumefaciens TaxID=358 RepID=UPI0015731912|nr:AAA family ATPase [Agrobacterium tumefaciens]NSZ02375.1 AAA family ATPase [Agrobacterium tumefaciens]NSZ39889.1 AAA family ATPase [Agrobacterium tumefaciens]NTB22015.1 AAA family ATPase [Agrobacterium tumefaciens]NTB30227.1 AAA family ATPase [Agrobacterium tumefaciens]NTB34252.1 AAA family ATPase [Agrobacterium tumefaciens]
MQSYSDNLIANRDPFHSSKYELTLPTHLAIIAMSRSIRQFLKRRSSFVAVFVMPPKADIHAHKMAAKWLLEGTVPVGGEHGNNYVLVIGEETELADDFQAFRKLRELKRAIILLQDEELLSDEVRIVADIVVSLALPAPNDYRIAAQRMRLGTITNADADFLAKQSPRRVELGWRRGRSVAVSIGRLRRYPHIEKGKPFSDPASARPTLHDLSGYGEAKAWGLELAEDITAWKAGVLTWDDVDCGVLLSGPPGSGKTSYADALARTCDVPLVLGSAARWQATGHLGDMLKAMRKAFSEAARQAPSILLIDEFDSFTSRDDRTGSNDNYHRQVVNALLELLDGTQSHEGVIVIGATNYPDIIDPALLRAGRLERHFSISLPDEDARHGIFRFYLRGDLADEVLDGVVTASDGWSGADIERCVRDARRNARRTKRPIALVDLIAAVPQVMPVPLAVQRCVAAHELGHAIVGVLLEADALVSVSIQRTIPVGSRSQSLGHTAFEERLFSRRTSTYFRNKIATLLGGIAAEEVLFGEFGSGAGGDPSADLNRATDLATMMETRWGLGKTLSVEPGDSPRELSAFRHRRKALSKSVEATLQAEFRRAKSLLEEHRDTLLDLHAGLLREGSLAAAVVRAAVERSESFGLPHKAKTAGYELGQ